jgi:uncharacterized protein (TIGR02147 family)
MSHSQSVTLLRAHLSRKQRFNPGYSLRAFARDIGVTPGFASQICAGKKPIPASRLPQIRKVLELDDHAEMNLRENLVKENLERAGIPEAKLKRVSRSKARTALVDRSRYEVLSQWFYLPIMDLLTCVPAPRSAPEISRRLDLPLETVRTALAKLESLGLVENRNGRLEKAVDHVEFPANTPQALIQAYHRQMLEKAASALASPDYDARLVTGVTLAVNPDNLKRAKARLSAALQEVIEILTDGPCTDVYQLNTQLFPLTKK